ncbi:amidohydrolase [Consotaella salsifontis]|uniref:Hippurate hydrolase n=1 Tax=Consotaella salsifontis TaxID=1365950 RepID=A0A1T4T951_9HYPH|nr:amidohydrolase [Consotaella salsifontis]SKA37044.1 hippurate hydrolase [Consotaella salsifontis]
MLIPELIASHLPEVARWRRHLHSRPELGYAVEETAAFIAERLADFGCDEVVTGIGRTGVVGVIAGTLGEGPTIGLRADMDALPIVEETGLAHASLIPGRMHACGHDGHMAMLLGAARALAATRRFRGRVAVIFQPAEEGGAGGKTMVEDGLMERFSISQVFGMHNLPGLDVGRFAIRHGATMASTDEFAITVKGRGGHAAMPHRTVDPVAVAIQIVQGLQLIVARNADPLQPLVLSITQIHAGETHNIIAESATISGTVRSLTSEMRDLAERRIGEIAAGTATAHGAVATVAYDRNYPVTRNHDAEVDLCIRAAMDVVGAAGVDTAMAPLMVGEDFSYMLEARPGAFIFVGNGPSAGLHHPRYEFSDEAISFGASYWTRLAEIVLAAE